MKASNLLNTQVFFENDTRLRGLVRDIRVRDHKIDCLVLSEGGLFSKAQIIFPSDIIEVDYDHVTPVSYTHLDVYKRQSEYRVMSVPTLKIFKDGEVKESLVGGRPLEELEAKLMEYQS